jgi:hypothetical protein
VQRRVELLDTKAPIALINYLVALKDLLSILEESIIVGIQGGGKNKGSFFHASQ